MNIYLFVILNIFLCDKYYWIMLKSSNLNLLYYEINCIRKLTRNLLLAAIIILAWIIQVRPYSNCFNYFIITIDSFPYSLWDRLATSWCILFKFYKFNHLLLWIPKNTVSTPLKKWIIIFLISYLMIDLSIKYNI